MSSVSSVFMVSSALAARWKSVLMGAYFSTRFSTVFFAISSKLVAQGLKPRAAALLYWSRCCFTSSMLMTSKL